MSKEINIYLAAKMTGVDDYNYPAIIAEAIKLKIMTGCHIVHTANAPRGWKYEDYIKHSLEMLRHCDAVYLLPGWEGSEGVERELAEAFRLGRPVFECVEDLQAWIRTLIDEAIKTETTGCRYCRGIESHGIVAVKTVIDEYLRVTPAYDTPYNYCPNCGRKIKEQTGGTERKERED